MLNIEMGGGANKKQVKQERGLGGDEWNDDKDRKKMKKSKATFCTLVATKKES
jgi:hypothetical protein